MWTDRYDPRVVRAELAVLADHGCGVTRSFCYWPDFVPEPERLDERVLERFADFLDAHRGVGMGTIVTFIVGHMSGENWDPSWRGGRDLYRDVWLVSQQAWFVEQIGRRFHQHPAIAGWLLSNEMPLYGGPGDSKEVTAWARILLQALRASGAAQPASTGDGAWGIEATGRDNGYSLRSLAPLVDFLGPHVYPMTDDPVRQHLSAAFACEMAGGFGRPVVLEEFGLTSDFAAEDHAAHYYRQVLYSTLVAGATGWLAWNNTDYDGLADQDPYRHHPFEMHFGLTDHEGRPKAALRELASFAWLLDKLPMDISQPRDRRPRDEQVRVVVPEHFERALPFATETDRANIRDTLLQCYVAAREADLTVRFERERDGLGRGAGAGDSHAGPAAADGAGVAGTAAAAAVPGRLYLLPSAKQITAPGARELRRLAEAGATVYYSFFAGSTANQRGPWVPWIDEFFGVRQRLRYGLCEPVVGDTVGLRFTADFGPVTAGSRLEFAVGGNTHARARLPVEPAGARVVAVDDQDRPALLVRETGQGRAVLCTYPVEYLAARTAWVNPEPVWTLYDALAEVAGVTRPLRCADPRISCATLRFGDRDLAVVTNLSPDRVAATVVATSAVATSAVAAQEAAAPEAVAETARWEDTLTGAKWGTEPLPLGPYEATVAIRHCGRGPGSPHDRHDPYVRDHDPGHPDGS
jgi:endo-1,4-beta-mannosidase